MAQMLPDCSDIIPSDEGTMLPSHLGRKEKIPCYEPPIADIYRGILPGLRHVVHQHLSAMSAASQENVELNSRNRVTISKRPNTNENPVFFPVDPYGNNDFVCKLCSKELSNVYFHCDGYEQLLSKDLNICHDCLKEKRFKCKIQMHPANKKRHSTINHTGKFDHVLIQ